MKRNRNIFVLALAGLLFAVAAPTWAGSPIASPRVAFVYLSVPGDGGWTFQLEKGRVSLEKALGLKVDFVENVPEGADAERVIAYLAQNHDVIFTTSFGYMDPTANVAKKFPKVVFEHLGGFKRSDNLGTYLGKDYEASYLSGIVAGKMTKKNVLGYVAPFPISQAIDSINAYTLGAQSVNPKIKTLVVWTNTWFDPTVERQAATSLLDQGADVLIAYQDSPATLQAAAERGAYAGGNDSDMVRYAPKAYLTNPVWNWGPFNVKTVQAVKDGTWKSEAYLGSIADGMVDIAPLGSSVPADVAKLVADAKAQFVAGKLEVFAGPLSDQDGKERVAQGKILPLGDVLVMTWLVKGVEGKVPQ
jgi:basic membrane protein A